MRFRPVPIRWPAAGALGLAVGSAAWGQKIEQVRVQALDAETLVRIVFDVAVEVPAQSAPASRVVNFGFSAVDPQPPDGSLLQQTRTSAETAGVPGFTISYRPMPARQRQRMTLELEEPAEVTVLQGPTLATLDIVLGSGPRADAPCEAGRYALRLQEALLSRLETLRPVPAQLQHLEVFTSPADSRAGPAMAMNLGWFRTEAAARKALAPVLRFFPQAVVCGVAPESASLLCPPAPRSPSGEE